MASRGKKKITMAKLSRESRLRERRVEKQARKNARKQVAAMDRQSELAGPDAQLDPEHEPADGDATRDDRRDETELDAAPAVSSDPA